MNTRRGLALTGLILFAIFTRFLPHPWNWTAIGAAALLGGARFERFGEALLVPLAALVLSDLVIGFHSTMGFVYAAVALTAFAAHVFAAKMHGWRLGVAALAGSVFFYLITNFGVWWVDAFYAPNLGGLLACYVAGLPFLATQALGDLFYVGLLFTAWDFAERRVFAVARR